MDNKRKFNFTDEKGLKESFNNMMKNLEDNTNFQTLLDDFIKKLEKEIEENIQHKEEEEQNLREKIEEGQEDLRNKINAEIKQFKRDLENYEKNKKNMLGIIETTENTISNIKNEDLEEELEAFEGTKELILILENEVRVYKNIMSKNTDIKLFIEELLRLKERELATLEKFIKFNKERWE